MYSAGVAKSRAQLSIAGFEIESTKPWRMVEKTKRLPIMQTRARTQAQIETNPVERWRGRKQNPPIVTRTAFENSLPCCGNCIAFALMERVFEDATGVCTHKGGEWAGLALFDRHVCDDHIVGEPRGVKHVADIASFQMTLTEESCASCAAFIPLQDGGAFGVCAEFRSPLDGLLTMHGNVCAAYGRGDLV